MNLLSEGMLYSLFLGIALATAVGFRVFLPYLLLSISAYFFSDVVTLNENFLWLSNPISILFFAIASLIEIGIYYIPTLNNKIRKLKLLLSFVAGILVMKITLLGMEPILSWGIAVVMGGVISLFVCYSLFIARRIVLITTYGIGYFLINSVEILGALFLSITAIFISPLAFLIAAILIFYMIKALNRIEKRSIDTNISTISVE